MFSCVSHFILWHNVCNKLGSFLFVHKMFCNVSYFRFSQYKENSYFTFIFLFSRTSFAPTDKIAASYILLEKGREDHFQTCLDNHQLSFTYTNYKCILKKDPQYERDSRRFSNNLLAIDIAAESGVDWKYEKLEVVCLPKKKTRESRLPLKHFHTSASWIHISNTIYSEDGQV